MLAQLICTMRIKSCSRCHEFKNPADFDHSRASRDGRHHRCKACDRKRDRQRIASGALSASSTGWQNRNPQAVRAHRLLHAAIHRGEIQRQPCVGCGTSNAHGHHEDYSKPLDVVWLCRLCHHERHRLERLFGSGQLAFELLLREARL